MTRSFRRLIFETAPGSRPIRMTIELWPDKDLIHACVDNKAVVRNLRTIKLGVRRIRTGDEAGSFMRIPFAHRILAIGRRIFLGSFLWSDRRCDSGAAHALRRFGSLA